jgi:hypothetical protein
MAEKRTVVVKERPPESEIESELPEKFRDKHWDRWLKEDFLRYWYLIGCVFVDVVVPLELGRDLSGLARTVLPIFALAGLIALEAYGYYRYWMRPRRRKDSGE